MFNSYLANYQRVSDFFKHAKWEQSCSPILRPLGTLLWIGSLNGTIWDMNIITNIPFNIWMFFQGTNRISRCVYINELHGYISVFSFVAIDWMYSKSLRTIILYVSIQDWPCFFLWICRLFGGFCLDYFIFLICLWGIVLSNLSCYKKRGCLALGLFQMLSIPRRIDGFNFQTTKQIRIWPWNICCAANLEAQRDQEYSRIVCISNWWYHQILAIFMVKMRVSIKLQRFFHRNFEVPTPSHHFSPRLDRLPHRRRRPGLYALRFQRCSGDGGDSDPVHVPWMLGMSTVSTPRRTDIFWMI